MVTAMAQINDDTPAAIVLNRSGSCGDRINSRLSATGGCGSVSVSALDRPAPERRIEGMWICHPTFDMFFEIRRPTVAASRTDNQIPRRLASVIFGSQKWIAMLRIVAAMDVSAE